MKALFAPAIALMNGLRYRNKFLLLGAVGVVIAVPSGTVVVNLSRDIKVAEDQELAGLQMLSDEPHNSVHATAPRSVVRCPQWQ